ncbi:MAG TPA: class I SAM-dependent methyltransferase [Trebonia sp.]
MPSLAWNLDEWGSSYEWADAGEEWSVPWGGSEAEWQSCILPRVARFLPADSILEIAPGFGRWTERLIPSCNTYLGVDLAERCVTACAERFGNHEGVRFDVNDGRSLPMVPDGSTDLVFSFDSLVHVEDDIIGAYLKEFRRVLGKDGVAFIHHSNIGVYRAMNALRDGLAFIGNLWAPSKAVAGRVGLTPWDNQRGRSMTAERFVELSRDAGVACIGQEIINWSNPLLIDCISVVTQPGSKWERPNVRTTNRYFRTAARSSAAAARVFLSMKAKR